ncbi:MAG: hypothetical protein QOE92_1165 [Chloroflexota bacterium]|nr:hypothetical protein [Chloroflexota bacterium]
MTNQVAANPGPGGVPAALDARAGRAWMAPLALGAVALAAIAYFDFAAANLALTDDWMYMWDVQHLVRTGMLRLFPDQQPASLVQVLWSAVATAGHPDAVPLRLSLLPFVAMAAYFAHRLGRDLGASRTWAAIAAAAFLVSPYYFYLAASYHTDIVFAGLLMAAAWCGLRWLSDRRWLGPTAALVALATLERQWGVGVAVALTLVVLRRDRLRPASRDLAALGFLLAVAAAAALLPFYTGLATPTMADPTTLRDTLTLVPVTGTLLRFAPVLGVVCMPFVGAALAWRAPDGTRTGWIALGLGAFGVAAVGVALLGAGSLFGKELLSGAGVGLVSSPGAKPQLFGGLLLVLIEVLMVAAFLVLLVIRSRVWTVAWRDEGAALLLMLAGTQLAAAVVRGYIDRYLVLAVLPLLPVLAAQVSRAPRRRWAEAWALVALAGWLAASVVGQQDVLAWQAARDVAARQAYALAPPLEVYAGFEPNAVYAEIPYFEATGTTPPRRTDDPYSPWALYGPAQPRYVLCFARRGNPLPGAAEV